MPFKSVFFRYFLFSILKLLLVAKQIAGLRGLIRFICLISPERADMTTEDLLVVQPVLSNSSIRILKEIRHIFQFLWLLGSLD